MGDRLNVRSLHLRSASSVYNLNPGHRAGVVVSSLDRSSKGAISERPLHDLCSNYPLRRLVFIIGLRPISENNGLFRRIGLSPYPWLLAQDMGITRLDDGTVLFV